MFGNQYVESSHRANSLIFSRIRANRARLHTIPSFAVQAPAALRWPPAARQWRAALTGAAETYLSELT